KTNRLVADLVTQRLDTELKDLGMVVDQLGQLVHTVPGCIVGVVASHHWVVFGADQCVVSDGDYPLVGKAINSAKGFKLLKKQTAQAGPLFQQSLGGVAQVFVIAYPATGERPL